MHCVYINLESKPERKQGMEKTFLENCGDSWTLSRFNAIDTTYVEKNKILGSLRDREKACFLSHKYAIRENRLTKDHLLVLEDDVIFGKDTVKTVESTINQLKNAAWDIIYCEVCIPDAANMFNLVKLKQELLEKSTKTLIDVKTIGYAGATSYIINSKSKDKVINLLDKHSSLNIPYDLYLRQLVYENKLNALVIFPFVTSFSEEALNSDIRIDSEKATELMWITYRKLIWQEGDPKKEVNAIKYIKDNFVDEEADAYSAILGGMLSKTFMSK